MNEASNTVSDRQIISHQPATGEELWRGDIGDVDICVERARAALRDWAHQSLGQRIELVRRFANEVRRQTEPFAELIARETGKPL
jgi:succinylglutamic semialdehyde dehydrogenase